MWLRNYDIMKIYSSLPAYKFDSDFTESARPYLIYPNGNKGYLQAATSTETAQYANLLNYNWVTTYWSSLGNVQATVDVGTDNTAVKYDDYGLKSPLTTSSITKTIVEVTKPKLDLENNKYTVKISIDFKNITADDITIKEWAIFVHPYNVSSFAIKRVVLAQADWKVVPANSYCRIDFEYDVDFPTALANWKNGDTIADSWETIVANANAGTVDGYSVGDKKTLEFTYNDVKYIIQTKIVGKNHDTISGTEDKAALTFLFEPVLWFKQMNTTNTNVGGWMGEDGDLYDVSQDMTDGELTHGCAMRKFVASLITSFPELLQNNIKTVDKIYDAANVLRTAKDKLWITSMEEVNLGNRNYLLAGQGTPYEAFTDNASRLRANMSSNQQWWSRSRNTNNSGIFWSVTFDGSANINNANSSYGCVLGFCI